MQKWCSLDNHKFENSWRLVLGQASSVTSARCAVFLVCTRVASMTPDGHAARLLEMQLQDLIILMNGPLCYAVWRQLGAGNSFHGVAGGVCAAALAQVNVHRLIFCDTRMSFISFYEW